MRGMPKISDARRAERRAQIIDAARRCFQRNGVHATTMDDIIRASGLSAGAVYGYFKSKDELTLASLSANLSGLREALVPYLQGAAPPPGHFLAGIAELIVSYSGREGYDSRRIHIMGWGEAQRNEAFRELLRAFYIGFRGKLRTVAESWQAQGTIPPTADVDEVAKATMALLLGFVAESTILEDVAPEAMGRGLTALIDGGAHGRTAAKQGDPSKAQ